MRHGRSFGIVEGYGGHGIGRQMHMDPFLPNEGSPGRGPLLAVGSVLAIEPMLTLGTGKTRVLDDDWTVTTTDGSRAAHWEHTVAVTEDGPASSRCARPRTKPLLNSCLWAGGGRVARVLRLARHRVPGRLR